MRLKTLSMIVIPGLMSVATAQAEGVTFTAEPILGYSFLSSANYNTTSTSGNSSSTQSLGSLNGVVLGARGLVGFADMFFAGPDFSYYAQSYSAPSGTSIFANTTFNSVNNAKLGLVAGIELPKIPFRFWLGYNFLDKQNLTDVDGDLGQGANTAFTLSGYSFKVGAGYKFMPFLAANLEFIAATYTSSSYNNKTVSYVSGTNFTNSSLVLSVSAPFTFNFN